MIEQLVVAGSVGLDGHYRLSATKFAPYVALSDNATYGGQGAKRERQMGNGHEGNVAPHRG